MASIGTQQSATASELGVPTDTKRLQNLFDFIYDLYILSTIALKLSDPEYESKELTFQEKLFLEEFYLPEIEDVECEEGD